MWLNVKSYISYGTLIGEVNPYQPLVTIQGVMIQTCVRGASDRRRTLNSSF